MPVDRKDLRIKIEAEIMFMNYERRKDFSAFSKRDEEIPELSRLWDICTDTLMLLDEIEGTRSDLWPQETNEKERIWSCECITR